ncbi:hypothetical protein HYX11_02315 [Candidatus Woesearchaeota archaeon]|nr:hypothetical protein [Candidatus Woesearchaeota archaeon]
MMINFKNKKGDTSPVWWIIVTALLAILVVIFILIWFKGSGDKAFGGISKNLDSLGDFDNDKVANFFDRCPCIPILTVEEPNLKGCPKGITAEQMQADNKLFSEKNCVDVSGTSSNKQTPESQKLVEQSKQPVKSSFMLLDGDQLLPTSGYVTSSNSLSVEFSCTKKCTLRMMKPVVGMSGGKEEQKIGDYPAEFGGVNLLVDVSVPGSYSVCLKEDGAKEICYNVKKN